MNIDIEIIGKSIYGTIKVFLMVTAIITLLGVGSAIVNISQSLNYITGIGLVLHHNQLGGNNGTVQPDKGRDPSGGSGSGRWKFKENGMSILQCLPRD